MRSEEVGREGTVFYFGCSVLFGSTSLLRLSALRRYCPHGRVLSVRVLLAILDGLCCSF